MSRVVRKQNRQAPNFRLPLTALLEKHLEDLRLKNYSEYTTRSRRVVIGYFLEWAFERGITEPVEVTRTVLESLAAPHAPLPQEERRAAALQRATRPHRAVAGVVQVDGAASLHPAQSGFGDQELPRHPEPLSSKGCAQRAAKLSRFSQQPEYPRPAGAARPRHPGNAVLDRHAAAGAGESVALGSGS